ncbi:MAG: MarR family transcriptional regulator [Alphaproteobacteria bacterium]|nr:MarR family transcriptional regulator [Alphaproteobacteria bacterium]
MIDRESPASADTALEIRTWLRLLTCTTMITRELRGRLKTRFDVTLSRFDAMAQLYREPDGVTMGQMSQRMMVTNGNVTWLVDRMVEDGLAKRTAVPGDGRAQIVRLTKKGRADFEAMMPEHHGWIHAMLDGLSRKELNGLLELLSQLKMSVAAKEGRAAPPD